jgi:hypothetical protein
MTRVTQVRALLLVLLLVCASCSTTRYHIVRHGEKLNETDDSPLNEACPYRKLDSAILMVKATEDRS